MKKIIFILISFIFLLSSCDNVRTSNGAMILKSKVSNDTILIPSNPGNCKIIEVDCSDPITITYRDTITSKIFAIEYSNGGFGYMPTGWYVIKLPDNLLIN